MNVSVSTVSDCTSNYFRTEDDRNQNEIEGVLIEKSDDSQSEDEEDPAADDEVQAAFVVYEAEVQDTYFRKTLAHSRFSTLQNSKLWKNHEPEFSSVSIV